jgi:tetratricopeptide (TPR) repeat protein
MDGAAENEKFALTPRQPSAVEKAEPGVKRVLETMVADALTLVSKENAKQFATPQPSEPTVTGDEGKIFSDPSWRAACAAEAAEDWVECVNCCKELVAHCPNNAIAYYVLGLSFHFKNSTDHMAAYLQAIELEPGNADPWENLVVSYRKQGKFNHEITAYQQAIRLKPDYAEAWFWLGVSLWVQGLFDDAIAAYRQAVKYKPDYAKAWYMLGQAYGQQGNHDDEISAFRQAVRLKPDYTEAGRWLGVAYRKQGKFAAYRGRP